MKIGNRQQLLGFVAIAVVVLWAGDRLVLTPLVKSWNVRSERLTTLRKNYHEGSRRLAWEKDIQAQWDRMRTNALSGDRSTAESQMRTAFSRWARDSGVTISAVRAQPRSVAQDYQTIECTVDASGNLTALTRFLYQIEHDPLALKVDMVRINSRDNTGQRLELALQVSGLLLTPPRPTR